MRPQAQAWIGDEENFFAIDLVPALAELLRVVALEHCAQIAIVEADALNLFFGEMAGAPGDFEAALGRAVNEVRGGAQVAGQIGIGSTALSVAGVPR